MSLKQSLADENVKTLISNYNDPTSSLFLTASAPKILKKLRKSTNLDGITKNDIETFRNYLSDLSREKEQRLLRGKKRESSFRQVKKKGNLCIEPCRENPTPTPPQTTLGFGTLRKQEKKI